MFALNVTRKTCYDEVTAQEWTGSTDEFRRRIQIYSQLRILSQNSYSRDPVHLGGHLAKRVFLIIFSVNMPSRLCRETRYIASELL